MMDSVTYISSDPVNFESDASHETSITLSAEASNAGDATTSEEKHEGSEIPGMTKTAERRSETSNLSFPGEEEISEIANAKNLVLQQDLENALTERNGFKVELDKEKKLRQITEDAMDGRQEELEVQEAENARLIKNLEEHKVENTRLEKELNETRDHIFRLQPRRRSITETEAQESFQDLYASVHRWVQNRLEPILNELDSGQLRKRSCQAEAASRLLLLASDRAKKFLTSDESDEYHVTAMIMQYLCENFFSRSFYCPLDDEPAKKEMTVRFLKDVELAMRRLPRDLSVCREWRSETLTALVSQPEFETRRSRYGASRTEDLTHILAVLTSNTSAQELSNSIWTSMISPAMNLAHELQLASNIFSVTWSRLTTMASEKVTDKNQDFGDFTCINVLDYGKELKFPASRTAPAGLWITYLFDVCPGLYCQSVSNDAVSAPRTLCRSRVLVAASGSSQKLPAKVPTLLQWLCDGTKRPGNF